MKTLAVIISLILGSQAVAAELRDIKENCGTTLGEVKKISEAKFPELGTRHINAYKGDWFYSGNVLQINDTAKFAVGGYEFYVCPRDDKKFDVIWKKDGTLAGVMRLAGKNQVVVAAKDGSNIAFDRAGTQTAGQIGILGVGQY